MFHNGRWSTPTPNIAIFDDHFVAANVCSGIEIDSSHREALHELILGSDGVSLVQAINQHAKRIEELNRALNLKGNSIPSSTRGPLSIDDFCGLPQLTDPLGAIAEKERLLAAARSAAQIRAQSLFSRFDLPSFDVAEVSALLSRSLDDLDTEVLAHISSLGPGAEAWLGGGLERLSSSDDREVCPFCTQTIRDRSILDKYRAFFGEAYKTFKKQIGEFGVRLRDRFVEAARLRLENSLRSEEKKIQFWRQFMELPELDLDISTFLSAWQLARETVLGALREKYSSPLDSLPLSAEALALVEDYEARRVALLEKLNGLLEFNGAITCVKDDARGADVGAVEAQLAKLRATNLRHSEPCLTLCREYLDVKNEKANTERAKAEARAQLDQYRSQVLPRYSTAINTYLRQFNAGFRLGPISSVNPRGRSSCNYTVMINEVQVSLTAENGPSFRNTLSAGDRNTLALAFFFASLDHDPHLAEKVVVLDDPMNSLDEHRSRNTVHAVRDLLRRVSQVIVLSHSKTFLLDVSARTDSQDFTALTIQRTTDGSTLSKWDIEASAATEHERRHRLVTEYLQDSDPARARDAAAALRPLLEAFLRIAYPGELRAGEVLNSFMERCQHQIGRPTEILNEADLTELRKLTSYGNLFHHESNPSQSTDNINDQELADYCRRVLSFTRRPVRVHLLAAS